MSNIFKKCVVVATTLFVLGGLGYANGVNAVTQEEYDALLARIDSLIAIIESLGGSADDTEDGATITGCTISSFDRALMQTMSGDDVKCMQIILNTASDTEVAPSGVGSAGEETNYFGALTKAAVIKFQEKYTADILATYGLTEGTGYVGTTTRAKLDVLLGAGSGDPVDPDDPDDPVVDPDEPAADGTVAVSLVSISNADLAKGSVGVDVASFKFVSGAAATLDSIKLTRSGLGDAADYSAVYIYDGATRLKSGRTISSESNEVEFTNIGLSLADGTSKTVTVKVDVYTSATTGHKNIIGVASLADISVSGGTLTGSAMTGAEMEISAISIGTATLADGGTLAKPSIGATAGKVAKIKITAGNNDITFDAITLTNDGSISEDHLTNFVLKDPSGNIVATADSMVSDQVILTLTTPFAIGKVQNKTFSLYATIGAAKTTDGIRFYLDESTDITITDSKYSQGAAITNSLTSATYAKCVGSSSAGTACAATGSLQGGTITLSDNGPVSNTVSRDTTNVELLNFSVVTTRDVTVKDYTIKLNDSTDKQADTVATTSAAYVVGTSASLYVTDSTGYEVDDYIIVAGTSASTYAPTTDVIAKVTAISGNTLTITPVAGSGAGLTATAADILSTVVKVTAIRLVNADTDAVLYSDSTNRYFFTGAEGSTVTDKDGSDDFDLDSGTTYNLSLRVDISAYSAPDMELIGGFYLDTTNDIKERDVNQYIAAADIVPTSLDGKTMTVGASSLTVARASLPVSDTKVKGTDNVDVLGIALNAGSASDVKITNLVVKFIADSGSATDFASGTGDKAANSVVAAVNLYDGTTKIAGPKSLAISSWITDDTGSYDATFDDLSYVIPAGTSQKLTVKADVVNTTAGDLYLAATVDSDDDITAEDADGNSISITADTYGSLNDDTGASTTPLDDVSPPVVITVSTSGTLSAKVEGTSDQAIIVAGTSNVVMAKYKFSALDEAFTIDKLDVIADIAGTFATAASSTDNNIVQVGIRADGGVAKWSQIADGKASFSSLSIAVPVNGNVYVEVLADINTIANGATSGATPRLGISVATTNTFRAIGAGSSVVKTYSDLGTISDESGVNAMTVRKTAPTIAKVSSTTQWNTGENTLYKFTIAADAAEAVSLKRFTLTISSSETNATAKGFKLYRGSTNLTDKVSIYDATLGDAEASDCTDMLTTTVENPIFFVWDGTTEETVPSGSTYTYEVKATVATMDSTGDTVSAYIADDAAVLANTTARTAIGGYSTSTASTYHANSTAVAAADFRITATDKITVATTASDWETGEGTPVISRGYGITTGRTLTIASLASKLATAATGTLITTDDYSCNGYTAYGGTVATSGTGIGEITYYECSTSTGRIGITFMNGANGAGEALSGAASSTAYTITNTDDGWAVKTLVAAGNSDIGAVVVLSGTDDFVWSDNSADSHDTTVSTDWTNGFLVDDLRTDAQTISY